MPYPIPTQTQLNERVLAAMKARLEGSDPSLALSFERIFALVIAGAIESVHKHLEYISRQVFPDTADEEGLLKWGGIYGVPRLEAQKASGLMDGTGNPATLLPIGSEYENQQGGLYRTTADSTSDGGGAFDDVPLEALEDGVEFNLEAGSILTLVSPVAGVDSEFVAPSDIDGGLDIEDLELYRVRVLERIAEGEPNGASGDYVTWAKEVEGVTRAFEEENYFGQGTVRVLFARDNDPSPVPDAGEIQEVQDYLQETDGSGHIIGGVAPIGIGVTVDAVQQEALDVTVAIQRSEGFDLTEATASIRTVLEDMLFTLSTPAGTIFLSQISAAIQSSPAVVYHTLSLPTSDQTSVQQKVFFLSTLIVTDV